MESMTQTTKTSGAAKKPMISPPGGPTVSPTSAVPTIQNEVTSILKAGHSMRNSQQGGAISAEEGDIFWTNREGKLAQHLHISGRLWWVYVLTILVAVTCLVANEVVSIGIIK